MTAQLPRTISPGWSVPGQFLPPLIITLQRTVPPKIFELFQGGGGIQGTVMTLSVQDSKAEREKNKEW